MNDTVSEDVKLDETGLEAAAVALSGAPFPMDASRRRAERAIRAYLAATKPASPLQGDVTVKALEWVQLNSAGKLFDADSEVGTYRIQQFSGERAFYVKLLGRDMHIGDFSSLEEAQSHAQADYEARILSALASPPMPGRGEGLTPEVILAVANYANERGWTTSANIIRQLAETAASRPKEDTQQ